MRSLQDVEDLLRNERIPASFYGCLFRLMQKADSKNWAILRKAFPQEAHEFVRWLQDRG